MIDTKEQYEQAQFIGDREFAHKIMDSQGLAWVVDAVFDLRETIEALQEVATAADSLLMLLGALGAFGSLAESGPDADKLKTLVDDLPDWIVDRFEREPELKTSAEWQEETQDV